MKNKLALGCCLALSAFGLITPATAERRDPDNLGYSSYQVLGITCNRNGQRRVYLRILNGDTLNYKTEARACNAKNQGIKFNEIPAFAFGDNAATVEVRDSNSNSLILKYEFTGNSNLLPSDHRFEGEDSEYATIHWQYPAAPVTPDPFSDSPALVPQPILGETGAPEMRGYISYFHEGGYVVDYNLTYTSGSSPIEETGKLSAGFSFDKLLPADATNVNFQVNSVGIVWPGDPLSFNVNVPQGKDLNHCFKSWGTVFDTVYTPLDCDYK